MKQLLAFIKKESLHLIRDVRTLLIIIGIPVAQIVLFGFAITTEVKNVQVAVFDPSKDNTTRQIIEKIDGSEFFDIRTILSSPDEVDNVFKKGGDINLVIVFGEDFEKNMIATQDAKIQLIADASDPNQGKSYVNYIEAILGDFQMNMAKEKGIGIDKNTINTELRMLYNPHIKSSYNFVPGVMGMILMLICALMTSISIVREKETGTMEVLLSSPIKPLHVLIAKVVPYFIISFINLTIILLLSYFLLKVPIAGNIITLYAISLLFIMVSLSLGILVSNIANTQIVAMMTCVMGLLVPVMVLSGMIFPIESMPKAFQYISGIIPARWYIEAVRKVMIQGLGIWSITREIIILSGMAFVLIGTSLITFKKRLM